MSQTDIIRKQFLRYLAVGAFATGINYGIFHLLLEYFHYLIASATGFLASVSAGYFFNRVWTFETHSRFKNTIIKYYMVYAFSLLLSILILKLTVDILLIDPRVANIIAIGITTFTNFAGVKFWVFSS